MRLKSLYLAALCLILFACNKPIQIRNGNLLIEINAGLETRVHQLSSDSKPLMSGYSPTEYLVGRKFRAEQFTYQEAFSEHYFDPKGSGTKNTISGLFEQDGYAITKVLEITVYDSFPDMAVFKVQYINSGKKDVDLIKWVNHAYTIMNAGDTPAFWSFQGSSTRKRQDWILPVDSSFYQKNYMGMNHTDCGGGIPLIDLWRKDAGIAIGHFELLPRMVSLPVEKDKYDPFASIGVEYEYSVPLVFKTGDTLRTYSTFVTVHTGDYFAPLKKYAEFMQASGITMAPVEPEAYEAVWCAWGYERNFTVNEILGTLPKLQELGIKWIDIDDGFQQAEGDWDANLSKFPNGDLDIRKMVDQIHAMGLKAKIWWAPLAIDPESKLLRQNPDLLLLNKDYVPQFISYWNSYYMSPVYYKTMDHTKQVIKMFLDDWDFDGLKIDGGFLNAVPPDYNPLHRLDYPEQSYENLPEFFQMIYHTATSFKPDAVIQICPCGMAMSFFLMPWMNQAVASDPTSSWQIRLKGKTYKALLGKTAYYGDHVELSDGGTDFASQVGIGAVLGTKFTWPRDNPYATEGKFVLTPENEKYWKKWISIYNQLKLPEGDYLGDLYDIGYNMPEAHVIRKSDTLYYAFYHKDWHGKISLRGLGDKHYKITDYVNHLEYGQVTRSENTIDANFEDYLLLKAVPEN
jgi:alpha-galactosidase